MQKEKTSYKLLLKLADGQFHSGETLGKELGMTRSAIWKAMKQLGNLGLEIQSITRKGYRIAGGLDLLQQASIESQLDANLRQRFDEVLILDRVDSTNDYLIERINQYKNKNVVVLAEQQLYGKGRRGRTWVSPYGNNIYCSTLWNFNCDPTQIMGLSIAISIAILNALEKYGITEPLQVKWPNDILWQDKKLAGVLVEMNAEAHERCSVVIGIGINTQLTTKQALTINQPWTSLYDMTQQPVDRNKLSALLINELVTVLTDFEQCGLKNIIPTWQQHDRFNGQEIKLLLQNKTIKGTAQGINEKGEIIIKDMFDKLKTYCSGEVSLRSTDE